MEEVTDIIIVLHVFLSSPLNTWLFLLQSHQKDISGYCFLFLKVGQYVYPLSYLRCETMFYSLASYRYKSGAMQNWFTWNCYNCNTSLAFEKCVIRLGQHTAKFYNVAKMLTVTMCGVKLLPKISLCIKHHTCHCF